MKKFIAITTMVLLMFSISASALAAPKPSLAIGLNFGYRYIVTSSNSFNAATVGLSTELVFSSINLALAAKGSFTFGKGIKNINAQLFAKYAFRLAPSINLGIQVGAIYDVLLEGSNKSSLFIAPGIISNILLTGSIPLYIDAKFPVFTSSSVFDGTGFLKNFFYDVSLIGGYQHDRMLYNLNANVSNSNTIKLETLVIGSKHIIDFNVGLGVKAALSFGMK